MIRIKICVGSSCYLKGAQEIIDHMQKVIKEKNMTSRVDLAGAFCLGNCGDGIAISINDEIMHVANREEAEKILINLISGE